MANAQLVLLPTSTQWKLDEDTRRIGRAGLAQARAILSEQSSVDDQISLNAEFSQADFNQADFNQSAVIQSELATAA